MIVVADLYDPNTPNSQNTAYIAKVKAIMSTQELLLEQGTGGLGQLTKTQANMGDYPVKVVEQYKKKPLIKG